MSKIGCIKDTIKTERLLLTPLNTRDVNRYIEIARNMRTLKKQNPDYFLFARFDYSAVQADADLRDAVLDLLTSAEKSILPEKTMRLNICLKNGHIIGYIGFLYNLNEENNSDLGIFLDPKYEHKGYAFEAQKSLLAYYFLNCGNKIHLTIHPQNLPSYHLNTKCGAVKIDHTDKSKYGSERDILVITCEKFLETVFHKKFKTADDQKSFLQDYLKNCS